MATPLYTLQDLITLMQRLRHPTQGCPWDIQQTLHSLIPNTLEEVYEVVDAIEQNNPQHLKEELGDLLFQIVFYSQLATEQQQFTLDEVIHSLTAKLVRRHPHVFPSGQLHTPSQNSTTPTAVTQQWEALKQQERTQKGQKGLLDDVPLSLPALTRAHKLQKRAARVHLDFPHLQSLFIRLKEEITELETALAENNPQAIEDELGDVFFSLVNVSRHLHLDSETALRKANTKFQKRVAHMEQQLHTHAQDWQNLTEQDREALWQQAKQQ